jgi:histidyl-tRNA synthetase
MPKPIRWFTMPQLFRYERQQRGRLREHYQWNVDIVGESGVGADAEILAVALDALRDLGLGSDDIVARISDRRLLAAVLQASGVPEEHLTTAFGIVDKVERTDPSKSLQRLREECRLDEGKAKELLALLGECSLEEIGRVYGDDPVVAGALADLEEYKGILVRLGLGDFLSFDLRIVRGLAYYTGIVFEIFDRKREFRAVCGGGRYDRLLELVGGEALPATGFGMGDVVLTELLTARGLLPAFQREVDLFLVSISSELRPLVHELARAHREKGRRVLYGLREQSVKKQFSAAGTAAARWVVILGPDEVAAGVGVVRDMESGTEERVALDLLKTGEGLGTNGL